MRSYFIESLTRDFVGIFHRKVVRNLTNILRNVTIKVIPKTLRALLVVKNFRRLTELLQEVLRKLIGTYVQKLKMKLLITNEHFHCF